MNGPGIRYGIFAIWVCAACASGSASAGSGTPSTATVVDGSPSVAEFAIEGPLEFAPRPTLPAITAVDLMTRLYIFADDSMMGRNDPEGAEKGTAYLEREVRRIGLTPAGDGGTFFQNIGHVSTVADVRSSIAIDGQSLALWREFAPVARASAAPIAGEMQVVYGGSTSDSTPLITAAQAAGKLVILSPGAAGRGARGGGGGRGGGATIPASSPLARAAAILVISGDTLAAAMQRPVVQQRPDSAARVQLGPQRINITASVAERLLGAPAATLPPGSLGKTVRANITFLETRLPARNVVAILRGSDPLLRDQYVAIGAHSDHVGPVAAVDHDSLRAFNKVIRPRGANDARREPTPEEWTRIRAIRDSLARFHPARRDSINNGADDDGSGSVVMLEIAESLVRENMRPGRSILFVWHAAEEDGLLGSRWFTDNPTVPRDAIVAQLNMDMIGRGRASDHVGGGPDYLRLIGSRRLSTELGNLVERVNADGRHLFVFDYTFDAPGHPQNSYCRSDHYNYARFGIPIAYFGTGVEADYHMVSDEPQYINYPHMARSATLIRDIAIAVANLDHRPLVDKPKPDPRAPCRQ